MTARGIEIRTKLLELGKTQRDLVAELRNRCVSASSSDLSKALKAPYYPREINMVSVAYDICLEWEAQAKRKKK